MQRADQSLHEIGTSPFRAEVVVEHFGAFHDCASQEQCCAEPFETFGKVCLSWKVCTETACGSAEFAATVRMSFFMTAISFG
jgi:hypothetical protein